MASTARPVPLDFPAGIQRDGTAFDSPNCVDGQWVRFRNARPRKILGYKEIMDSLNGVPRRVYPFYANGQTIFHVGTAHGIQQIVVDQYGALVSTVDRTPATFTGGPNVGWTIDALFDTTSSVVQLVCHAVTDLAPLSTAIKTTPFIGQIDATTPLVAFTEAASIGGGTYTPPMVAGGICCAQPYVFDFDVDGFIGWSAPNLPLTLGVVGGTTGAGSARVSAQKIVQGMALRGGGAQSPAALFWSMSELISATFVGTSNGVWAFNTVSPSSSILSSDAIIEYDGLYFWAGVDRFLVYNGTVVEVPNKQNLDWFFDNLTPGQEAKTYAFKVPRFGEIWFCAPLFGNAEPSHAAIYNVRENCWYDTLLPNGGRSCGYYAQGLKHPVMGGSVVGNNGYSFWLHENDVDQIIGNTRTAIRSYFETPVFSGLQGQQPDDRGLRAEQVEFDSVQQGDISIYVVGSANVKAPDYNGATATVPAIPATSLDQLTNLDVADSARRLLRLHIESNCIGGYYNNGKVICHMSPVEARRSQ